MKYAIDCLGFFISEGTTTLCRVDFNRLPLHNCNISPAFTTMHPGMGLASIYSPDGDTTYTVNQNYENLQFFVKRCSYSKNVSNYSVYIFKSITIILF